MYFVFIRYTSQNCRWELFSPSINDQIFQLDVFQLTFELRMPIVHQNGSLFMLVLPSVCSFACSRWLGCSRFVLDQSCSRSSSTTTTGLANGTRGSRRREKTTKEATQLWLPSDMSASGSGRHRARARDSHRAQLRAKGWGLSAPLAFVGLLGEGNGIATKERPEMEELGSWKLKRQKGDPLKSGLERQLGGPSRALLWRAQPKSESRFETLAQTRAQDSSSCHEQNQNRTQVSSAQLAAPDSPSVSSFQLPASSSQLPAQTPWVALELTQRGACSCASLYVRNQRTPKRLSSDLLPQRTSWESLRIANCSSQFAAHSLVAHVPASAYASASALCVCVCARTALECVLKQAKAHRSNRGSIWALPTIATPSASISLDRNSKSELIDRHGE